MTKRTLPQPDDRCQKLVLDLMLAKAVPLTAAQINNLVRVHQFKSLEVRGALVALEESGYIASDLQPGTRSLVYFIDGHAPSRCCVVPASEAPRIAMPARTWYSGLGAAA